MLNKETTATATATAALGPFESLRKSATGLWETVASEAQHAAVATDTVIDNGGKAVMNSWTTARDTVLDAKRTVVETDYFVLLNKMTLAITRPVDRFQQILNEANYHAEPRNIWSLLFGRKRELPETTSIEVGGKMFDGSKKVTNRFMWTAIFAAFTTHTLIMSAIVMAVIGGGLFMLEFSRAKKDREDIITEVNFAGQRIEGRRADLCRLHQAQVAIMNLASTFRQASLESTTDTIARIMEKVEKERKRVKILDPGPYGALTDSYDFSRPQISLVNKDEREYEAHQAALAKAHHHAAPAPVAEAPEVEEASSFPKAGEFRSLRGSWKKKRDMRQDDIVETLAALQKSLPPMMRKKLAKELQKVG